MGQFTRSSVTSSLDRINVARLIVQLRRQFAKLVRPYLFQPNDSSTRNQIKYAAESMLIDLVGQRALYDFAVVCDTSNNTPTRIDNGEVYLDVAIEPTKAVEFIYIPLRLLNTGEVKTLGAR
jgi:phage tail sheath protein FI